MAKQKVRDSDSKPFVPQADDSRRSFTRKAQKESARAQDGQQQQLVKTPAVKKTQRKPFDYWLKKNRYYHQSLLRFYRFVIPKGERVLQVNCKNGYLLAGVSPSVGVGVDKDSASIDAARERHSQCQFHTGTLDDVPQQTFGYVVLTSVTMEEYDIQDLFYKIRRFCRHDTRIVIDTYSYLWEPILWLTQKLGLRRPTVFKNWISQTDLHNFLHLAGFAPVTTSRHTLIPMYIPFAWNRRCDFCNAPACR